MKLTHDQIAFVESLLGRPWKLGAQGPDSYDCWSLMRSVQARLWGRDLPLVQMPAGAGPELIAAALAQHPGRRWWQPVEAPIGGDGVEMVHVKHPRHVGIWLEEDGGLVLHATDPAGVTLDSLVALRALGWRDFRFYRWVGPCLT